MFGKLCSFVDRSLRDDILVLDKILCRIVPAIFARSGEIVLL